MGRDKALLELDGVALARRVADAAVGAGAETVVAVGGDRVRLEALGLTVVEDPLQGSGPLGGVRTALRTLVGHRVVVVLPCDLAEPSPRSIARVAAALGGADVAVPRAGVHLEPLHAAWRPGVVAVLDRLAGEGVQSVQAAIGQLEVTFVDGVPRRDTAGLNSRGEVIRHVVGQNRGMSEVPEIEIDEFARRREAGEYVLDVRQTAEFVAAHVPGAALVPLDQLADRQAELPKDVPLLVICKTGARSAAAVRALVAAGYDATNVAGGTMAWMDAGHPVDEGPDGG